MPLPSNQPPSSTSFTDTIIRSQEHNQSPVNCNWHVHNAWIFNSGVLKITFSLFFRKKKNPESHWAESNKGWVKDATAALVQGSKEKSKIQGRPSKGGWCEDETRCKHIIGEKEKNNFNIIALVMGNPSDCRRRTTIGEGGNSTVMIVGKSYQEMQRDLSPLDRRHDLG